MNSFLRTIFYTSFISVVLLCGCYVTLTHLHLNANLVVIEAAQQEYEAARLIQAVDAYVDWQENGAPIYTNDLMVFRQYLLDRIEMLEETNE